MVGKRHAHEDDLDITFGSGNEEYPNHDDALVISTRMVNAHVKRVMIDTGTHLRTLSYKKVIARLYNHRVRPRFIKTDDLILRKAEVIVEGLLPLHRHRIVLGPDSERIFLDLRVRVQSAEAGQRDLVAILIRDLADPLQSFLEAG
ncbi:hypothetical protein BHM03_00033309 [Ensete ventricosum]|nr:hypothetical protein BHM03_00033309 [Ensete ventricosum]